MMYEFLESTRDVARLNELGSVGWRAVGMVHIDHVLLMREITPWPAPVAYAVAHWAADPTGRFQQRYWDGMRWTEHVSNGTGHQEKDWPTRPS